MAILITGLLGKRVLLKLAGSVVSYRQSGIQEYRIVEIAPSGNWVKLQNIFGNKFWKPVSELSLVEELKDINADKPKD